MEKGASPKHQPEPDRSCKKGGCRPRRICHFYFSLNGGAKMICDSGMQAEQALVSDGVALREGEVEPGTAGESASSANLRNLGLQTLQEIAKAEFPQSEPIVDRLLGPGETTLLIARQKEGKSTLALQLAADIATGSAFLGRFKTSQQQVLYIDYENRPEQLKMRALDIGQERPLDSVIFKAYDVIADRDITLSGPGLFRLTSIVKAVKPGLLVIDPLRLAIEGGSSSERTAVTALNAIAGLKHWKPDMAVLLVHHLRKSQRSLIADLREDPHAWVDKIYGSQAFLAHADNFWGLEHDDLGYAFGTVARSTESLVLSLEREPESQRFGVSHLPAQLANLSPALLAAWHRLPQGFSRTEGMELGIPNNTIDRLIRATKPIGLLIQDPKTKRYRKA
jgi:hypothetical protein